MDPVLDFALGVILAGGRSTRMGQDKALLPFNRIPMIQLVHRVLATVFDEIVVVGRPEGDSPISSLHCLPDDQAGLGPVGGLLTALRYSQGRTIFLVGCDMPFLNRDVIRLVLKGAQGQDAAVPVVGGWVQPLHAAYNGSCMPLVERQVKNRVLSMRQLVRKLRVHFIGEDELRILDPELRSVQGLNTPQEYARAVQSASDRP